MEYDGEAYAILNTCTGGSTGKIASGLHLYLIDKNEKSIFCFGRMDKEIGTEYYKIDSWLSVMLHVGITRLFGLQGYGSFFSTKKLIAILRERKVKTVFIVSLHGYYINENKLFSYFISDNIRVVYIMIDEYAFVGKCGIGDGCIEYYRGCHSCKKVSEYPTSLFFNSAPVIYQMKKRNYEQIRNITFVGPLYTVIRARKSPLLKNKEIVVLDEAIDTSFFTPKDCTNLMEELGIEKNRKIIVCIARYSLPSKGCKYFVELARKFENDKDYVFVHVGFDVNSRKMDLPKNLIPIGFLKDQNRLAYFLALGDLFVFPSLSDTMPNTCLEALSAGTPLLCFNISGMPYIADETVATFVDPRNVKAMEAVVRTTKKKDADIIATCRQYALQRYDNKKYFERLLQIAKRDAQTG